VVFGHPHVVEPGLLGGRGGRGGASSTALWDCPGNYADNNNTPKRTPASRRRHDQPSSDGGTWTVTDPRATIPPLALRAGGGDPGASAVTARVAGAASGAGHCSTRPPAPAPVPVAVAVAVAITTIGSTGAVAAGTTSGAAPGV
jgi:hypothetical protein